MKKNEVSIAVYTNKTDALANAENMHQNGFDVFFVMEVEAAINWNNFTVQPPVLDDANVPAWVVIVKR